MSHSDTLSSITALCKRRGFIYPSSDLYGGLNGFWDYGPLGTALKSNLRDAWWHAMVDSSPNGPDGRPVSILGLDSAVILHAAVWKASGHTEGFHDALVDCRETQSRYRADHLACFPVADDDGTEGWVALVVGDDLESRLQRRLSEIGRRAERAPRLLSATPVPYTALPAQDLARTLGPDARLLGSLTAPRSFNLMLKTSVGAMQDSESTAYLRPETAQGIFVNFKNVVDSSRARLPFGIAQVGKAFRNEITPRNFIFRSREFEQMELEWFCDAKSAPMWHDYWVEQRERWWKSVGIADTHLRRRAHGRDELAHYSSACTDIEFAYPFSHGGYGELEGIANRGDYDLRRHQDCSRQRLTYVDPVRGERLLPHVIEPSAGLTRGVLAVLCDAYRCDESRPSRETLHLAPHIAPVKLGVFPLTSDPQQQAMAEGIFSHLRTRYASQLDAKQSIGKRYARMDEIGTPLCITVDAKSACEGTVTVRDRDTCAQERVSTHCLEGYLDARLGLARRTLSQTLVDAEVAFAAADTQEA